MNRTISIAMALFFAVLALSNFTLDKKTSFIMTVVNEEPVLPEIPYKYVVEEIPDYLADPDTNPVPYYVSQVQTNTITSLDNDIATLGRVLFYDKKLSALENISCATCHDQSLSFAENKPVSDGIASLTQRNAMHLNDLGWSNSRRFSWDMEQTSLAEMIQLPLTDTNEIGANLWEIATKLEEVPYYKDLFAKAYGGEGYVTKTRIVDALDQFISSMNTFNSKFDQHAPTEFVNFTESEKKGMAIFQTSCTTCHTQGNTSTSFSAPAPTGANNNGLPADEGDLGAGDWNDSYTDLFKLTTMRNIELTAPYMHDGRFNTLEEVIEHYSTGVEANEHTGFFLPDGGYDFTDQEKVDLLAFMKTLTDDTFISNPKWSNPFQATSSTNNVLQFEDLVLRPNPMSDRAIIEFKNDKNQLVSINILSSDGRLIKHDNTTASQYELEKSTFQSGMYYIELVRDDAKSVQKLIVQ